MSLYNELFGVSSFASALLLVLGIDAASIPRFRDCYLDDDGRIVIYTRTGGGNRMHYDEPNEDNKEGPWNSDLRKLAGYISDEDDDFDSTFAYFYFKPPAELSDLIAEIKEKQGERNPRKAWEQMLADLNSGKDTPAAKRALEVGERVFGKIEKAMKDPNAPKIIKI